MPSDLVPCKGCFGGECNRATCTTPDARYFHRFKHAYYCGACAKRMDITEVPDPTQPACFDYPQKPDAQDRHKTKREQKYALVHPDLKDRP